MTEPGREEWERFLPEAEKVMRTTKGIARALAAAYEKGGREDQFWIRAYAEGKAAGNRQKSKCPVCGKPGYRAVVRYVRWTHPGYVTYWHIGRRKP